jgi:hypothetical protein
MRKELRGPMNSSNSHPSSDLRFNANPSCDVRCFPVSEIIGPLTLFFLKVSMQYPPAVVHIRKTITSDFLQSGTSLDVSGEPPLHSKGKIIGPTCFQPSARLGTR